MGPELPKNWGGSKNESMLEVKNLILRAKFNFAAIGIYHTFTLEKDSGPQLFIFFSKNFPKAIFVTLEIAKEMHRNWY